MMVPIIFEFRTPSKKIVILALCSFRGGSIGFRCESRKTTFPIVLVSELRNVCGI